MKFLIFLLLFLTNSLFAEAQEEQQEYEDITVFLMVQNVGGFEIDAIYLDDNIYVNVATLFNILKINHSVSPDNDSVTGFFLDEQQKYSISKNSLTATVGDRVYKLDASDIFTPDLGFYLKNTVYGKVFGLNLNFNFRSLALELKTAYELPVIKELRQEQMRKNIDRLEGVVEVDTVLKRNYHLFRGAMADWSVISTQVNEHKTDTRASLSAGVELLGGEATGMVNYSTITGFDDRQQQYKWRWANNDAKLIRQIQVGKLPFRSTSSIYAPVIGGSITNTPTTFRKSFGSYTLTDYTEPGWTVELYINNVLVDFTTADASGFFSFNVPLVYGTIQVVLKFYGPWGEERVREQTINIPYNFLPKGTMEYNISGGIVRDSSNSTFSRAETQVGISRNLTMGGGIEYLSALKADAAMPFLNASARFMKNFLFTGEYTHGVRTRGILNYRLPSNFVIELDYAKYVPGQKAISFNYLEERKASLAVPIKIGNFRSFARMTYRQNVLPLTTFSSTEALLSSYIGGVSTNISAFANWLKEGDPYIYSNVALGFRLSKSINFRPQAQIDITNKEFISYKAELEKNFSQKAHLSLIFEDNLRSQTRNVEISFRYDLPFAQTAASARFSERSVTTTESARGSFAFGSGNGYIHSDNRSATGRGGLTVIPFIDINNNNIREENEPIASGLSVRLNGGRILKQQNDSLIRINELEPYASYLLELDDVGFENIAWQLSTRTMSIQIDPNQFKKVAVPIKVKGEVNGTVLIRKGRSQVGQGRIIIHIIDEKGNRVTRLLTESDGYFNYLGLMPGKYIAQPDTAQLKRLGLESEPESFEFTIKPSGLGDIIDDIQFVLIPFKPADSNPGEEPSGKSQERKDDTDKKGPSGIGKIDNVKDNPSENKLIDEHKKQEPAKFEHTGNWFVQAGAYLKIYHARVMLQNLKQKGYDAAIVRIPPYHKVRIAGLASEQEAIRISKELKSNAIENFIGQQ